MSLGDTSASVHVEFYGVQPSSGTLSLDGRALFTELSLHAPVRRMPVEPSGELTTLQRALRPTAAKLLPPAAPVPGAPGIGDQWPDGRVRAARPAPRVCAPRARLLQRRAARSAAVPRARRRLMPPRSLAVAPRG